MIDSLPMLARRSVENHFQKKHAPSFNLSPELAPFLNKKAGAFVTLKVTKKLRGCIGTIQPAYKNLIEEICTNALSAAFRDPRFPAVTEQELPTLNYSVSVMHATEPITTPEQLDPQRYGVVVNSGNKRGLLLPHLEGIESVEQQLYYARAKAGITPQESVTLERFQVDLYSE